MSTEQSVRDLVVVIPGIMGSTLVDAAGRRVWSLDSGSLVNAIRTLGRSIRSLTLPAGIGDAHPGDGVRAVDLMPGLHVVPGVWSPVAGYAGLVRFLRNPRFGLTEEPVPNLITFPYDWRLSNRYNGQLLATVAGEALARWRERPGMAEAKLVLVAHSMGGLVARWFLEHEHGAELTRCLITIGTPHRGAAKSLATLANGLDPGIGPIRLSSLGLGRFGLGLSELARSMPSLHQLLPTYKCLQGTDGSRQSLHGVDVPGIATAMLADALRFHEQLDACGPPGYAFHKVVGTRQPTVTTARIVDGAVLTASTIDGREQGGDGTVPRLAAEPTAGRGVEVHEVADQHGELQGTRSALDLIDGIVSREELIWEGVDDEAFGVTLPEICAAGVPAELVVTDLGDRRLSVVVLDEDGGQVGEPVRVGTDGRAVLPPLPPGGYRARVGVGAGRAGSGRAGSNVSGPGAPPPVTRPFLVWDPTLDGADE